MKTEDNKIYKNFGKIIADERKKKDLSQYDMSKMLDIPQTTYANYELGTRKVSLPVIKNICDALDLEVNEVFEKLKMNQVDKETKEIYKKFGSKIRRIRESRKMTMDDVSKILNIANNTYSNYENGNRRIPLSTVVTLAKIFDMSVDELISDDEPSTMVNIDGLSLTPEEYKRVFAYAKLLIETRGNE